MNEGIFSALLTVGLIIFVIWSIFYSQKQNQKAKQQVVKLIRRIGGQHIVIEHHHAWGNRGVIHFKVKYIDADGIRRRHRVSRHLNFWGTLTGDFLWDKPLQMPQPKNEIGKSSSKEQIISEMDAEIKRLQEELRRARIEN
jgi:hypothetical protein